MGGAGGDEPPPPPPRGRPTPPPPRDPGPRRGFREQLGATRAAGFRLVAAHVALARVELEDILAEVKKVAALIGVAIALVLFAGILFLVGTSLFLGEWLFGSMGWGILHDTELSVALAIVCVLVALDVPVRRLVRGLVVASLIGLAIAVVGGLLLASRLWEAIGVAAAPALDPATRPLVVGTAVGAGLGAIAGLLGGTETGGGRSIGGVIRSAIVWMIIGALGGAVVGALSAITFSWQVAVALGIAVALGLWVVLCILEVARGGIDFGAWSRKFYPSQTIESAKETIEWVRERTPLGPKS
jgi:hypothetical protein